MKAKGLNRVIGFFMSIVLAVTLMPKLNLEESASAEEDIRWAYVHVCGSKNILQTRKDAGLGYEYVVDAKKNNAYVYGNQKVQILGEKTGTDKNKWYKIAYDFNGKTYQGYLRYDFIIEKGSGYDEEYAESLRQAGFPESYIEGLCYLHSLHDNWVFTPYFTGGGTDIESSLDWAISLEKENTLGYSLLPINSCKTNATGEYYYSWFSHAKGAYDSATDTYKSFDSGNWVQASNEIIAYYMDPRNFLNEKGISMFRSQAYNPKIQTLEGTQKVIANSFMAGNYDGKHSYASLLITAAEKSGVSPYVLANKIMQEVGTKGATGSVSGTVAGYEGLYNYFNVGAAQRDGKSAIENGLIYASKTDAATLRPWNTRYKAVVGGSIFFGSMYVNVGQSNHYLQKFNMSANRTYAHQYMGNILDPAHQAYGSYSKNTDFNDPAEFLIPVFKNMPEEPCPMPLGYYSPNAFLKTLAVDGVKLTPTFSYSTLNYTASVTMDVTQVTVLGTTINSQAKISGTGTKKLVDGNNVLSIVVTAGDGTKKTYKITIYKPKDPSVIEADYSLSKIYPLREEYLGGIAPQTKVADFMKNLTVSEAKLTDAAGKALASDSYCTTGCILTVDDKKYTLCVKGDVSPDGAINVRDLLFIKKYLMGAQDLSQEQMYAGAFSNHYLITVKDLLLVKQYLLGVKTFEAGD